MKRDEGRYLDGEPPCAVDALAALDVRPEEGLLVLRKVHLRALFYRPVDQPTGHRLVMIVTTRHGGAGVRRRGDRVLDLVPRGFEHRKHCRSRASRVKFLLGTLNVDGAPTETPVTTSQMPPLRSSSMRMLSSLSLASRGCPAGRWARSRSACSTGPRAGASARRCQLHWMDAWMDE